MLIQKKYHVKEFFRCSLNGQNFRDSPEAWALQFDLNFIHGSKCRHITTFVNGGNSLVRRMGGS